jgi:hypothetical protein
VHGFGHVLVVPFSGLGGAAGAIPARTMR